MKATNVMTLKEFFMNNKDFIIDEKCRLIEEQIKLWRLQNEYKVNSIFN